MPQRPKIRKRISGHQSMRIDTQEEGSVSNEIISIKFDAAYQHYAIQVLTIDGTILTYQRVNERRSINLTDKDLGDYNGLLYITLLGKKGAEMKMMFRG